MLLAYSIALLVSTLILSSPTPSTSNHESGSSINKFKNPLAESFLVKTSQLPLFGGIKVQDSYAGRLALKGNKDGAEYSFWYFPTTQVHGSNKVSPHSILSCSA
jgi:hypothetical protein